MYFEGVFGKLLNNVKLGSINGAIETIGHVLITSGSVKVTNTQTAGEFKNISSNYSTKLATELDAIETNGRIRATSNSDVMAAGYFVNAKNNHSVSLSDASGAITANGDITGHADLVISNNKHGSSVTAKTTTIGTTTIMACPDGTFMTGISWDTSSKNIIEIFCKNI